MGGFSKHGGLESGNRLVSLGKKLDVGLRTGVNGNHGMNFAIEGQESLMHQTVGFDVGDLMNTWDSLKAGFNQFMDNPLSSLSQPGPFSPNGEIAETIDEKFSSSFETFLIIGTASLNLI